MVVREIPAKGPAAKSDLRPGDVITAVDGRPVTTSPQLKAEIRSKKVGQPLTLDVYRNGKNLKVKVKTDVWPDETTLVSNQRNPGPEEGARDLGLTVKTLTGELAEQFNIEKAEGVVVTAVEPSSAADEAGIRRADIILEVDRKAVRNVDEYKKAVAGVRKGRGVLFLVRRGDSTLFLALKPPR